MSKFQELINGDMPVLVDFFAEWCGPCKVMAPELKKLVEQQGERVRVIKIDVDKNQQAATAYQISSVPTLVLRHKGQISWKQSGVLSASQLGVILAQKGF